MCPEATVSEAHFVEELKAGLQSGDRVKLGLLIDELPQISPTTLRRVVFELARSHHASAGAFLAALISCLPTLDSNATIVRAFVDKLCAHPEVIGGDNSDVIADAVQRIVTDTAVELAQAQRLLQLFGRLANDHAIELLDCAMRCAHATLRNEARAIVAQAGRAVIPKMLDNLDHSEPDYLIPSLSILGDLAASEAIDPIRRLLGRREIDENVRFAAYETLGRIPHPKSALALVIGLGDPSLSVATAAAAAAETSQSDRVLAGLRNAVGTSDGAELEHLAEVLLNGQAKTLCRALLDNRAFADAAARVAARHPSEITSELGLAQQTISQTKRSAGEVWAIDDSALVLRLYGNALRQLGHAHRLFQDPLEAIEAFSNSPEPLLIFVDLNMPQLTGIELVRRLRQSSPAPMVLVTAQADAMDLEHARQAGVTEIFNKPFDKTLLGRAIDSLAHNRGQRDSPTPSIRSRKR